MAGWVERPVDSWSDRKIDRYVDKKLDSFLKDKLLAMGGVVGAIVADVRSVEETGLSVLVGGAAFLGAGYGTPIAAVAFVAETTGLPGFLIPGVVAVAAGQIVMSNRTVSPAQTAGRVSLQESAG